MWRWIFLRGVIDVAVRHIVDPDLLDEDGAARHGDTVALLGLESKVGVDGVELQIFHILIGPLVDHAAVSVLGDAHGGQILGDDGNHDLLGHLAGNLLDADDAADDVALAAISGHEADAVEIPLDEGRHVEMLVANEQAAAGVGRGDVDVLGAIHINSSI